MLADEQHTVFRGRRIADTATALAREPEGNNPIESVEAYRTIASYSYDKGAGEMGGEAARARDRRQCLVVAHHWALAMPAPPAASSG